MTAVGKLLAFILAVAAVAWFLAGGAAVRGEEKRVAGTAHDIASPDTPPCILCHVPRDPEGQPLWSSPPNSTGAFSGLAPLCFSCHDGTVAGLRSSFVFDPARPQHAINPGQKGQDCDRCHDPHYTGYGKFIKLPGGANFCRNCHFRAGPTDHPVDADPAALGIIPLDTSWNPSQGDFTGTRLWNLAGTGPGNLIKCLTCHSPHSGQPDTAINTVAFSSEDNSYMPLCLSCHPRGGGR